VDAAFESPHAGSSANMTTRRFNPCIRSARASLHAGTVHLQARFFAHVRQIFSGPSNRFAQHAAYSYTPQAFTGKCRGFVTGAFARKSSGEKNVHSMPVLFTHVSFENNSFTKWHNIFVISLFYTISFIYGQFYDDYIISRPALFGLQNHRALL